MNKPYGSKKDKKKWTGIIICIAIPIAFALNLLYALLHYMAQTPEFISKEPVIANVGDTLEVTDLVTIENAKYYGISQVSGSETYVISEDKHSLMVGDTPGDIVVTIGATGENSESRDIAITINVQ